MTRHHDEQHEQETPARVIVGVDASDNSLRAAVWAAEEAAARGVALTLVHALDLPGTTGMPLEPLGYVQRRHTDGRELLEGAAATVRERFPNLTVDTQLSELSAARTLGSLSTEAALLVTGTRGHGGFVGMLLGSVSRKLAAHAHCPVVVVRGEAGETALDEIVLGIEPGQSPHVLRYAFAAASRSHATLHAVRVWSPVTIYTGPAGGYYEDVTVRRVEELRNVDQLLAPLRTSFPEVKIEISIERGNPVPLLIEAARPARLLVVGAGRHRGPLSVGAGYTVDGLLAHSPTPVAVVPTQDATAH